MHADAHLLRAAGVPPKQFPSWLGLGLGLGLGLTLTLTLALTMSVRSSRCMSGEQREPTC